MWIYNNICEFVCIMTGPAVLRVHLSDGSTVQVLPLGRGKDIFIYIAYDVCHMTYEINHVCI